MQILQNISLRDHSTMRLGGNAAFLAVITSRAELHEAVVWADEQAAPIVMIGQGSNVIWRDEGFNGLVLVNAIAGYEDFDEDGLNHYVTVGSGEPWDSVVARTVTAGLSGIEALSLIPGTTGATPIQNVGAYGQEISQTLASVEAYDRQSHEFINIPAAECGFGYRMSRFKNVDRGRFFISGLTFHLLKTDPQPPFYGSLQSYLDTNAVRGYTPAAIRDAVIAIRCAKLPDPAVMANNGSFFANPVVDTGTFAQINATYDTVPHWLTDSGQVKLSAAWLIEQAGFRDYHDPATGMATWPAQSLVFVNEHATSTADVLTFRQKVIDAVKATFGVTLIQEPELLP